VLVTLAGVERNRARRPITSHLFAGAGAAGFAAEPAAVPDAAGFAAEPAAEPAAAPGAGGFAEPAAAPAAAPAALSFFAGKKSNFVFCHT
jgi:hypothetical protein